MQILDQGDLALIKSLSITFMMQSKVGMLMQEYQL